MIREQEHLPASRARLAAVLRAATSVISTDITAATLGLDRSGASKLLARWREQGWLRRVGRGLYVSVPLDLAGSEQVIDDPWVLVPTLFDGGYIGGWTAAHHWDLTEQLFNVVVVCTPHRITKKKITAQGIQFLLHHVQEKRLFGLKALWRGSTRVMISDPARTLIDMIDSPEIGGGIDHVTDCLGAYLSSKTGDRKRLIEYAEQFDNGAIFKRLGFIAETRFNDHDLATACRERLSQGNTRLDPALACDRLVTSWRLWIPSRWSKSAK